MSKLNFETLKDEKVKELYKHLWGNSDFDFDVVKSGKSGCSYKFNVKVDSSYVEKYLAKNFCIGNRDLFSKNSIKHVLEAEMN